MGIAALAAWLLQASPQVDPKNFETAGRQSSTLGAVRWKRADGGPVRIVATDGRALAIDLKSEAKTAAGRKKSIQVEAFLGTWVAEDKTRFSAALFVLADTPEPLAFKFRQFAERGTWKINDQKWRFARLPAFDMDSDGNNCGDWVLAPGSKDSNTAAFTDNPGSWGVQAGIREPRFDNYVYANGDQYEFTLHLKNLIYASDGKTDQPVAAVSWTLAFTATVGGAAEVSGKGTILTRAEDLAAAEKLLQQARKNGRTGSVGYVKE